MAVSGKKKLFPGKCRGKGAFCSNWGKKMLERRMRLWRPRNSSPAFGQEKEESSAREKVNAVSKELALLLKEEETRATGIKRA